MRKRTKVVTLTAISAAALLVVAPTAVGASAPPGAADAAGDADSADVTRVEVPLSHPTTVEDALTLVDDVDLEVVGVRHEQPGIEGEFFIDNGQSLEAFLDGFEGETGTMPQAVSLIAAVDNADSASARNGTYAPSAAQVQEASEVVVEASASLPEFIAPLATPTQDVDAKVAASAESASTDTASRLASATWFPHYNEIFAMQSFSDVEGADTASVAVYSIWNGGSNSPDVIPTDWGIEVDTYQYNDAMIGVRPGCAPGVYAAFWGSKGSGPSGVASWYIYNLSSELPQTTLGAYYDWVDGLDACSDQSLSIGIGYPRSLSAYSETTGGSVVLQTVIHTARGTKSSSPMSVNMQANSNDCNDVNRGPASDCMGLNTDRTFPLGGAHIISGRSNGYSFPGCFYTYWDETAQPMACP